MSKFVLAEPDDEDLALFSKEWTNVGEIIPIIHKLEDSVPDKRTKFYTLWLKKINYLIDLYNKMTNEKILKKYE